MPRRTARKALLARMQATIDTHAERTAVRSPTTRMSYGDFSQLIGRLCRELRSPVRAQRTPVGLLLERSAAAYAAMWAAIALGRPYVPLNEKYPSSRLRSIVTQAGIDVVICTEASRNLATRLGFTPENTVMAEGRIPAGEPGGAYADWTQTENDAAIAYILFTSGSTGEPKGVPISYENLYGFIENMSAVVDYNCEDVCSQMIELSFDLSVHEIYLALLNGCTLCPAREIDLFNPARYVAKNGITIWVSVPSLARVVLHNGLADQAALATLRVSVFNGEALTTEIASDWNAAARGSEIWNTYGPTECTVAVSAQHWQDVPDLCESGIISIGTAFADCTTALRIGEEIVPVEAQTSALVGELLLSSSQCFNGYLDPDLASPFITDSAQRRYYRTGDRVLQRGTRLFYLERIDHQVKIGGHRIELLEVEHRVRKQLGSHALAVIAHPRAHPTELVLFLASGGEAPKLTCEELGLPDYMVPQRTIAIDALPVTTHGKLDRNALHERMEDRS